MPQELAARLKTIILNSSIRDVLVAMAEVSLPDCWLAGGAVRNTVWKVLYGQGCQLGIKDFDVVFFDSQGDRAQELKAKAQLEAYVPNENFDVKNQASFGVWRPWRMSFASTSHGISNWLHTATAVGVRFDREGEFEILAPYGLSDLFDGIIRPCPANLDNPDALAKARSLQSSCPELRIV